MALTIVGEHKFQGTMLAMAMIKAQAATSGGPAVKHAAGAGVLDKYLAAHSTTKLAMPGSIMLTPGVAIARASLCREDLDLAGEAIERVTDAGQRRKLLAEIVEPFFATQETLFGAPFRDGRKPARIQAGVLAEKLTPQLPELELTMGGGPLFKTASRNQVTNGQYAIFMALTCHREPAFWADRYVNKPVIGVNYEDDAQGFAAWLGRKIPDENILRSLLTEQGTIYGAEVEWEWTSSAQEGEAVVFSLRQGRGHFTDPINRNSNDTGFRVAA